MFQFDLVFSFKNLNKYSAKNNTHFNTPQYTCSRSSINKQDKKTNIIWVCDIKRQKYLYVREKEKNECFFQWKYSDKNTLYIACKTYSLI